MDPVSLAVLTSAASAAVSGSAGEAWQAAMNRLRARTQNESTPPQDGDSPAEPSKPPPAPATAPAASPAQAALSKVLEGYYKKVGRRADISFFAAFIAAVLGYVVIGSGIWVGVNASDDQALAIVVTAGGIFSQVLSFFFFRNRAEERKMMIKVLGDLRQDAEADARAVRALELIEQVQQPLLRDNLTVAVALELSGATADLKSVHGALKLFDTNGERQPQTSAAPPAP
ncbi:hypothetical protein ABZW18_15740 [Streptomyces sp. NPDC004647]|uniref:TRADD-N-associated membrane domain-containing protein n=1 Tax=Streptomyces sp. NPDC004647 TaxID=3154671 RepID=UPI00339E0612